jgi:hypothetical protein
MEPDPEIQTRVNPKECFTTYQCNLFYHHQYGQHYKHMRMNPEYWYTWRPRGTS